jgi:hypothetical protein
MPQAKAQALNILWHVAHEAEFTLSTLIHSLVWPKSYRRKAYRAPRSVRTVTVRTVRSAQDSRTSLRSHARHVSRVVVIYL